MIAAIHLLSARAVSDREHSVAGVTQSNELMIDGFLSVSLGTFWLPDEFRNEVQVHFNLPFDQQSPIVPTTSN
jgi:hypothetical protein